MVARCLAFCLLHEFVICDSTGVVILRSSRVSTKTYLDVFSVSVINHHTRHNSTTSDETTLRAASDTYVYGVTGLNDALFPARAVNSEPGTNAPFSL